MKMSLAAIAAPILCLALAGCGSEDSATDAGDEPTSPTKAEFIAAGDAICKASNDRIAAAESRALEGEVSQKQLLAFVTDTVLPEVAGQAEALRELPPPDEGASTVDAMLDSLDAEIAKGQANPRHVLSEESGFEEANQLARDYGFKVCGEE